MLVVNDLTKLANYGFRNTVGNIYEKTIWEDRLKDESISLLVNQAYPKYTDDNSLQVYVSIVGDCDKDVYFLDQAASLDLVYRMIKDGVVDIV